MQMTQVFFHSLVTEMKRLNLTHYTPENENEFIAIITGLTLYRHRGRATVEPTGNINVPNVGSRTPGAHPKTPRGVQQRSNAKTPNKQTKRNKGKDRASIG